MLVLIGVFLNASAQLLLKAGAQVIGKIEFTSTNILPITIKIATQIPIIGGIFCYAISLIIWIFVLSRVPVSIAYPILSIGYIFNAFAAWYLFGEILSVQRLVAMGIILVGVYLLILS